MLEAEKTKLFETAKATLKPIVDLASKSINGANTMKLRNAYAENLYESSELLYLEIEGMSKQVQANDFAPSQAPKKISHVYSQQELSKEVDRLIVNHQATFLDNQSHLLIIVKPLSEVSNGGKIKAVFSAESLKNLKPKVMKKISPLVIGVVIISLIFVGFNYTLVRQATFIQHTVKPDESDSIPLQN